MEKRIELLEKMLGEMSFKIRQMEEYISHLEDQSSSLEGQIGDVRMSLDETNTKIMQL